jgi:autotransporter-associated beta strand protein
MQKSPVLSSFRILTSSIATLAAVATFSPSPTSAASGSWNVDAAGNWGTAANWSPAAIPGTAAGDVINLQNAITVARTVTIDTNSRTAGDLNIGSTAAFGFTLASSATTVVLTLDATGNNVATIDFTANANTISAPLTLRDDAAFRSNVAAAQTLSGVISGVGKAVSFNNDTDGNANAATALAGQFVVSGANTFNGGTTISDVRVNITNNAALGSGVVNIQNGGQVYTTTALTGVANTFNIAGDGWVEGSAGQPFGALRVEGGALISGNVIMTANAAVGSNSATTVVNTISGIVSGAFTLSKRGTGNVTLSGNNIYTGGTAINNGSLILANNNAAGTGAITINPSSAVRGG